LLDQLRAALRQLPEENRKTFYRQVKRPDGDPRPPARQRVEAALRALNGSSAPKAGSSRDATTVAHTMLANVGVPADQIPATLAGILGSDNPVIGPGQLRSIAEWVRQTEATRSAPSATS
jgi:hypothetical protein